MSLLLTGILLIGLLAAALVTYYLAMLGWNAYHWPFFFQISPVRPLVEDRVPHLSTILLPYSYSTIKFKKVVDPAKGTSTCGECCTVCLTGFEDGEEVRQLPLCKHSFHGACIDTWLYSHSECPLCRSPVNRLHLSHIPSLMQNSREICLHASNST